MNLNIFIISVWILKQNISSSTIHEYYQSPLQTPSQLNYAQLNNFIFMLNKKLEKIHKHISRRVANLIKKSEVQCIICEPQYQIGDAQQQQIQKKISFIFFVNEIQTTTFFIYCNSNLICYKYSMSKISSPYLISYSGRTANGVRTGATEKSSFFQLKLKLQKTHIISSVLLHNTQISFSGVTFR